MGEALALAIDDKANVALGVEIDVLRPAPSDTPESETFDEFDQGPRVCLRRRKLDELDALHLGRRRKRRKTGEGCVAPGGAFCCEHLRPPRVANGSRPPRSPRPKRRETGQDESKVPLCLAVCGAIRPR